MCRPTAAGRKLLISSETRYRRDAKARLRARNERAIGQANDIVSSN